MQPTPQQKAQQGKLLLTQAIEELLGSYRDVWLRRTQIEEKLGIASAYEVDSRPSYDGGLASMLLSELHEQKKIRRERDEDGKTWLYRSR
jgi:hypothetical protein